MIREETYIPTEITKPKISPIKVKSPTQKRKVPDEKTKIVEPNKPELQIIDKTITEEARQEEQQGSIIGRRVAAYKARSENLPQGFCQMFAKQEWRDYLIELKGGNPNMTRNRIYGGIYSYLLRNYAKVLNEFFPKRLPKKREKPKPLEPPPEPPIQIKLCGPQLDELNKYKQGTGPFPSSSFFRRCDDERLQLYLRSLLSEHSGINRTKFSRKYNSLYNVLLRKPWFDEVFPKQSQKPR
jgi:hypothetical protein